MESRIFVDQNFAEGLKLSLRDVAENQGMEWG